MPNHVRNTIHFDCSEERLREILEAIQYDDNDDHRECGLGTIDFNKVISMPPSLNIEAGSSTDRGLKAYRDFIEVYTLAGTRKGLDLLNIPKESEDAFLKMRTDVERRDFDLGRIAFQNIQKYGADTWYDWSIRNWGTKWNSYDPDEYHGGHDIGFSTAWSAPHPILHKLMEMYPDAEITHRWADEDLGQNCGEIFYSDGLIDENIPDDSTREAQDLAFEMWGETPEELGSPFPLTAADISIPNVRNTISSRSAVSPRCSTMGDSQTKTLPRDSIIMIFARAIPVMVSQRLSRMSESITAAA